MFPKFLFCCTSVCLCMQEVIIPEKRTKIGKKKKKKKNTAHSCPQHHPYFSLATHSTSSVLPPSIPSAPYHIKLGMLSISLSTYA